MLEGMGEGKRERPRTCYISQIIKESMRTNNSNIKHKTDNHEQNNLLYRPAIYGLNTKTKYCI